MRTTLPTVWVRRKIGIAAAGLFFGISGPAAAGDPVFASPLPPGPGRVPVVGGSLVAPVLMPQSAPTAAPVGVYHYGPDTAAAAVPAAGGCSSGCGSGGCN